ncbi:hypothetical protein BVY04_01660 [bacterium M21]|nr:hypothetical protein BVY04_01660 [bacterium M21]
MIVFLLAFALMGIKVILTPSGEFKKNCSGGTDGSCSHCGRPADDYCDNHEAGTCEHEAT